MSTLITSNYSLTALLAASTSLLLSACGGGAGTPEQTSASTAGSTQTAATTTTVGWTRCASEGGNCTPPSPSTVRYGLNGTYFTKAVTGSIACGNGAFGDPAPGTDKFCDYSPNPAPATAVWTRCAVEDGSCSFAGTQQVRYGVNGQYAVRTATASISCSNAIFGDPAPGADKFCDYSSEPAPAPTSGVLTDSLFASNSFWYQPIPANAPLHPNSANFTNELIRQKNTFYGTVDIGTVDYSSPVYIAGANTPTTAVSFFDCQNKGAPPAELLAQWAAVPIPTFAQQAGGTDGEMTVYQPSTNTLWEFWQSSKSGNGWQACWGGQMKNVSSSNGIWSSYFGTTATGLPFLGGQITAEELKRGEIRHVMGISLAELEAWNIVSWPAQRSDGYNPNNVANRIPEGSRFRLDPSINIDALNMHPVGKIIAKAAQKYGFVVWDTAGNVNLRAQNAKSYTTLGQPDPYTALFNGTPSYNILDNFPWNKIKFLPMNYGKP